MHSIFGLYFHIQKCFVVSFSWRLRGSITGMCICKHWLVVWCIWHDALFKMCVDYTFVCKTSVKRIYSNKVHLVMKVCCLSSTSKFTLSLQTLHLVIFSFHGNYWYGYYLSYQPLLHHHMCDNYCVNTL